MSEKTVDHQSVAAFSNEIRTLVEQAKERRRLMFSSPTSSSYRVEAESMLRRAIALAAGARIVALEAAARHELGSMLRGYVETKNEGLGELTRALDLRIEIRDTSGQSESLFEIGSAAYEHSDLSNALAPLHEAERLSIASGNLSVLLESRGALSAVCAQAGRNEDALAYAARCLETARQLGDAAHVARAL